ncbi:MAG: hypothetical protein IT338_03295 [Thermomicrobiales bacterium]|nr:hypothetical protein [Thermomicrobiales bacterium]
MQPSTIDRMARALAGRRSRRQSLATLGGAVVALGAESALGRKRKNGSLYDRAKRRAERRASKKSSSEKSKSAAFPRDCRHFVIAAGPNRDAKFKHIDDDLRIELIPKGKNASARVLLDDDNNGPNGKNGDHIKVSPFTARVGDRIRIIARNEVVGGCELDEIWLHCIEGKGGKVKLNSRITPDQCRVNANKVGVFLDKTVRIKNK